MIFNKEKEIAMGEVVLINKRAVSDFYGDMDVYQLIEEWKKLKSCVREEELKCHKYESKILDSLDRSENMIVKLEYIRNLIKEKVEVPK